MFANKFSAFFVAFSHPIFIREKQNEVAGHMKHAAKVVTCTMGKLMWLQEDSGNQSE